MTVWNEVRDLIDDCDIDKLAAHLIGLNDAGRRRNCRTRRPGWRRRPARVPTGRSGR
ncbi:hypothetical protein ABZV14_23745 [Streptosporangium canum]|uniref:hypothetical protein n=1 Tax=Streptosporangium canum TaxID=324952 RepID=UPI0033A917B8